MSKGSNTVHSAACTTGEHVDGISDNWHTTIPLTVPVRRNLNTGEWRIVFPGQDYSDYGPERNAIIKADVEPRNKHR